jgi:hypothetical protein
LGGVDVNRELREWFGLTPADALVYLGAAAIICMYFVQSPLADGALSLVALAATIGACPIGMRRDEKVSDLTNQVKKFAYPACVVLALAFIFVNFAAWNS